MKNFYHLLNRGVDKRNIFLDQKDYLRFIHDLFEFNDTANVNSNNSRHSKELLDIGCPVVGKRKERKPRELLVKIHFFCLMPNHYHLLVSPIVDDGIPRFMKKLNMGYAKYFNEKNGRVGALFQGKYKSVLVTRDAHFLHLPYYIHFNPLDLQMPEWRKRKIRNPKQAYEYLKSYRWSSHLDYLGIKNFPSVTQRDFFLDFFEDKKAYNRFVKELLAKWDDSSVAGITLE